jgi:hypothetical protein
MRALVYHAPGRKRSDEGPDPLIRPTTNHDVGVAEPLHIGFIAHGPIATMERVALLDRVRVLCLGASVPVRRVALRATAAEERGDRVVSIESIVELAGGTLIVAGAADRSAARALQELVARLQRRLAARRAPEQT